METFAGRCPVKPCPFGHKADAEMLSTVLVMHLRDVHAFTISEATLAAATAVKLGQEIAFKVAQMMGALTEVFGSASPAQARSVLKALAGKGLTVRVADGTRPWSVGAPGEKKKTTMKEGEG